MKIGELFKTSKKLSSKFAVTIPKDVRLHLGWQPGMSVDLEPTDNGELIIRPHIDRCRFCGSIEIVHKYRDICVCEKCFGEMKEAIS